MVLASVLLSELTKAWLLYLGLIFLFMVMYAPGGVASLIMMNVRVAAHGLLGRLWSSYLVLGVLGLLMLAGAGALVEMMYHLQLNAGSGNELNYLGLTLDAGSAASWIASTAVALVALGLFEWVRRRFLKVWNEVQVIIEQRTAPKEGA
jgi:branched-chain amino acid transport system permease protein